MSKPQITIRIDGPAGSGKTQLAQHIAADLSVRHGVNVTLIDDGWKQPPPSSTHHLPYSFGTEVIITVEQK